VPGALDVSGWLELDRDREPVTVEVPCQWANLYPGDFRSPDEVLREAAADTIRRAAEKADAAAARREAERQREAKRKQTDQAAGDLGRLKDKYRNGGSVSV
jgi:hypothetical protein